MNLDLEGQVALVTGGAGGIGAVIAGALISRGANVAVVDISEPPLDALQARTQGGARAFAARADVRDTSAVNDACDQIAAALGPVSILVNNVGGAGGARCTGIEDVTDETWDLIMALNLGSAMRFSRKLVPSMKERRQGRIINIGSSLMSGYFGDTGTASALLPYATAKSGFTGFTRQLAFDLGPFGITVNAVIPGLTLPGPDATITKRFNALPAEHQQRMTANVPLGRLATGEDMANAVCFFASPASSFVSGQLLAVTGGGV